MAKKKPTAPVKRKPDDDDDEPVDTGSGQGQGNGRPAPAAQPRRYDPTIVTLAREHYGLSDDEIREIEPDVLKSRVLTALGKDRGVIESMQRSGGQGNGRQQQQQPAPAPAAPKPAFELDWGEVEIEPGKKRKITDDDFKDTIPGLPAVIRKVFEENQKLRESLEKDRSDRELSSTKDRLDEAFAQAIADLGDEGVEMFGDGGIDDYQPGSAEHTRRNAILSAAGIDFSKRPSVRSMKAAILKTTKTVIGAVGRKKKADADDDTGGYDVAPDQGGRRTTEPAGKRRRGLLTEDELDDAGVAPPTHREGRGEGTGDDAARSQARKDLIKYGLATDSNVRSEEDRLAYESLPDD